MIAPLAHETLPQFKARLNAIRSDTSPSRWLGTVSRLIDQGGIDRQAVSLLAQEIADSDDSLSELGFVWMHLTGKQPTRTAPDRDVLARDIAATARAKVTAG